MEMKAIQTITITIIVIAIAICLSGCIKNYTKTGIIYGRYTKMEPILIGKSLFLEKNFYFEMNNTDVISVDEYTWNKYHIGSIYTYDWFEKER